MKRGLSVPRWLCVLVLLFAWVATVEAAHFPPRPQGYVLDEVGLLSPEQRAHLQYLGKELQRRTPRAEVVVAILPKLDGNLEEYATALFRAWKLGTAKDNNGVLLLVYPQERRVRIEVGYGLEGAINDAKAGRILAAYFIPLAKADRLAEGTVLTYEALAEQVAKEYKVEPLAVPKKPAVTQAEKVPSGGSGVDWNGLMTAGFILVFGISLGAHLLGIGKPGKGSPERSEDDSAGDSSDDWSDDSSGGGSSGGGGASGSW